MNKNDGLYCLWTSEHVYAVRIIDGEITTWVTADELLEAKSWSDKHLSGCETMDDMPTVPRKLADEICEHARLDAELVAVCRVD